MARYEDFSIGQVTVTGISNGAVTVLEKDGSGNIIKCKCATGSIPSGVAGYAVGCLLIDTTTGKLYYNNSATSASFNSIADITSTEIASGAILSGHISTAQVISGHISAGQVVAAAIGAGAVLTAAISDNQVTSAKISANQIVSGHISAGQVVSTHLATGAVLTAAISDNQVTTAKISDNQITSAKISAAQVTNAKMKLSTVSLSFAAGATTVSTADSADLVGATVIGTNRKWVTAPAPGTSEGWVSVCGVSGSAVICTLTSGAQVSTTVDVILALA